METLLTILGAIGALAALAVGLLVLGRMRQVARAVAPASYEEVGRWLAGRRPRLLEPPVQGDDPTLLTTTGVGVVWTHDVTPAGARHHLSFSLAGSRMPLALGLPLLAFVVRRAGLSLDQLQPFVTQTGVLHAVAELDAGALARWRAAAPAAPGDLAAEIEAARGATGGLLARLERVEVPLPPS